MKPARAVFVSGCKRGEKYFCKIAGVNTLEADVTPEESVQILKQAVSIYRDLEHPNLIKLVETYEYEKFHVAVFEWADSVACNACGCRFENIGDKTPQDILNE